jgi:hypothetical protein
MSMAMMGRQPLCRSSFATATFSPNQPTNLVELFKYKKEFQDIS